MKRWLNIPPQFGPALAVIGLLLAAGGCVTPASAEEPVETEVPIMHPKLGLDFYVIRSVPIVSREVMLAALDEHLAYQYQIEADGTLFAAGPVVSESDNGPSGRGLIIVRADSFEAADAIAAADPFHDQKLKSYSIERWTVNEGSLSLKVRFSDGSVTIQ